MSDRDFSTGGHPDSADLVDFAEGRASASAAAEIDRHLEGCEPCRELVAALSNYRADDGIAVSPGDPYAVNNEEVAAALRTVLASQPDAAVDAAREPWAEPDSEPRPAPDAPATTPPAEPIQFPQPRRLTPARQLVAALPWAALIIVAIGWGLSERRSSVVPEPSAAIGNVAILTLQELGNPLRSHRPGEVSLRQGAVLTVADDEPLPSGLYTVRITEAAGATVLALEGLEPWPAGHLTFYLPPDALPLGAYEVELLRPDGTPWPRRFVLDIGP